MEAFGLYLLKSVIWLAGFALVYFLFLRNEKFFLLNRFYLLSGILISFFFPFISVHYTIDLPAAANFQTGNITVSKIQETGSSGFKDLWFLLTGLYISGILFVALGLLKQSKAVIKVINRTQITSSDPVKLIRTVEYPSSFSFFSYVFVNPSISDLETKEIVNHEMAHISQCHWVDLVLVELLCMLQWFNPAVWIYIRFIRQNHEYLADEVALQRTTDPAIYKATLLNQIVGAPVVSLSNSFNHSTNTKRFYMMKNIIRSPYRKMKILFILPVFAVVLYSFAKPEYRYPADDQNSVNNTIVSDVQSKDVKGTIVEQSGKPLQGATVVVRGTTLGSSTDSRGSFKLDNIAGDGMLVVSYVGFRTKVLKPDFNAEMTITMIRDTVNLRSVGVPPPPPPPPPPSGKAGKVSAPTAPSLPSPVIGEDAGVPPPPPPPPPLSSASEVRIRNTDGSLTNPLIVIDGVVNEKFEIGDIDPNTISSVSVLKDKAATDKYGEKAKDGAIEITTKKYDSLLKSEISDVKINGNSKEETYVVVEEMPSFPGGEKAIQSWIYSNIKVMKGAEKISGPVNVIFTVDSKGKVRDAKVKKPEFPVWEAEAIRVVSSMPDWIPGSQNGKPIDVIMQLPIDFSMKVARQIK